MNDRSSPKRVLDVLDPTAGVLASIGHELRAPLHAILGYAQLLEMGVGDGADHLRGLRSAGEQLAALVDDLTELGCLDAGALVVRDESVDLAGVIGDVLDLVRPGASVTLTVAVAPDAVAVRGDVVRLRRVLTNVVSNAVRYNRPGGTVEVRTRARGDRVAIEVVDTGRGIAAAELDRLFVPFDRLGAGDVPGTGLGLPLARALVEAMGGDLSVTSVPGVGTNVRVELRSN